jgi:hypothetical protein
MAKFDSIYSPKPNVRGVIVHNYRNSKIFREIIPGSHFNGQGNRGGEGRGHDGKRKRERRGEGNERMKIEREREKKGGEGH